MAKVRGSNFEVLEENRKAVLKFADGITTDGPVVIDTAPKLDRAKESIANGDLTAHTHARSN